MRADITTDVATYKMMVRYKHERGSTLYEVEWLVSA